MLQVYYFCLMVFGNLGTHAALLEVLLSKALKLFLFMRLLVFGHLRLFLHKFIYNARLASQVISFLSFLLVFQLRTMPLPEYAHLVLFRTLRCHAPRYAAVKFCLVFRQLSHRMEMFLPVFDVPFFSIDSLVVILFFSASEGSKRIYTVFFVSGDSVALPLSNHALIHR